MRYEALNIDVDYALAGVPGTGCPTLYAYLRDASPEMPVPTRLLLFVLAADMDPPPIGKRNPSPCNSSAWGSNVLSCGIP